MEKIITKGQIPYSRMIFTSSLIQKVWNFVLWMKPLDDTQYMVLPFTNFLEATLLSPNYKCWLWSSQWIKEKIKIKNLYQENYYKQYWKCIATKDKELKFAGNIKKSDIFTNGGLESEYRCSGSISLQWLRNGWNWIVTLTLDIFYIYKMTERVFV